jgi:hypothetical protein
MIGDSSGGFLTSIMIVVLLIYVAWKKIRAVPNYYTINVSLFFWSVFFILSIIFNQMWDWSNIWFLYVLLLPKLVLTVIEKKEILQWKRRIFKRSFNLLSAFADNTSRLLHRILRVATWIISFILILAITVGVFAVLGFVKQTKMLQKTNKTIDELFDRLNDTPTSTISTSDRIFVNQKYVAYLRANYNFEEIVGGFSKHTDKKILEYVANNGSWFGENRYYQYAFSQYNLGHPEEFLDGIKKSDFGSYPQTVIKAAFELGLFDDCRKLLEQYKKELENTEGRSLGEFDKEIIWTAEKVGNFEMVKASPNPSEKGGDLVVYQAHALLMTGEREQALSLYRKQINAYKNEIIKDFAIFRWLGFPDNEISMVEKELHLDEIKVYTCPDDDTNTASLAKPFIGEWQCEENGYRINWEIKDDYHLCHYLFQTKQHDKDKWIDDDIAVTRYRFKQVAGRTIIEEYNVRTNVLSVGEITLINDNELQINKDTDKVRVYKRVMKEEDKVKN